jgi:rhodanese-related sulfurtransferase
MDQAVTSVFPLNLYACLGDSSAPIVVDVRSPADLFAMDRLIPGSISRTPTDIEAWWRDLPVGRPVVICDASGTSQSEEVARTLRQFGTAAGFLTDGFNGWYERGLPTRRILPVATEKWVTRKRPKIDRIACPWLIRRLINPLAEFIYVPAADVLASAAATWATPYDIDGVQFTHENEFCSFDTILRLFDINIPALNQLATIVRGADTSRHDLAPQCAGLFAISLGLSANYPDDHRMLEHGMVIYDALYSWCRSLQGETHNWPPKGPI